MARIASAAVRESLYAILVEHAQAGTIVPPIRILRQTVGCNPQALVDALDALEEAGRIRRNGGRQDRSYFVAAIGKATEPAKIDRPGGWSLIRDNSLTAIQRQTLSVARRLIRQRGSVSGPEVEREMGLNQGVAHVRLNGLVRRGHLREIEGSRYVAAEVKAEALVAAGPRIEVRPHPDGTPGRQIEVKVYPPAVADGALRFGTMLGKGGVALAGGGFQKSAGRV
jgi:DNA-binding transcriptional MocR family regulator